MFCFVFSWPAILSNAGCSDAAANTVMELAGVELPALEVPPQAATSRNAVAASAGLITGQLHADVGRLDGGYRRHAGLEVEVVDRLTSEERDQAVGTRLDLHLGRHAVLDDSGHDAGKAVAGGLLDALPR